MKNCSISASIASVFLLIPVGCITPAQTVAPRMPFPAEEYERLPKTGTATVRGQAFLTTRGGDVKTAAGNVAILTPVTSFSMEWFNYARQGIGVEYSHPRESQYVRQKVADGDGRFIFKEVPAGEYLVKTIVQWEIPSGRFTLSAQGGVVTGYIIVKEAQEVDVIINKTILGQLPIERQQNEK